MKRQASWNLSIGSVMGIPIRIHITFIALLVWVAAGSSDSMEGMVAETLFVLALFGCVLLHELGHAVTARLFNVPTRDITLYPFGGIASLAREPAPFPEFIIATAGPVVSLIVAILLLPFVEISFAAQAETPISITERLFLANVVLGIFNLIPALPMDGGRMLRALLNLGEKRNATALCARISQVICVAMGLIAIFFEQPLLLVVAFLIFFAAIQERVRFEAKRSVVGMTIGAAMVPAAKLETIPHGTPIVTAARMMLTSSQTIYPVVVGTSLLGLISRDDLLQAAVSNEEGYIGNVMEREVPSVERDAPLSKAFEVMETTGSGVLIVNHEETYQGLILRDRLYEYLVLTNMQHNQINSDDAEWFRP